MALNPFNDNIKIAAPKALDDNRGVFENGVWRPYNSKAEVLEKIPLAYRYIGLQVDILIDGEVNTYWFQDGIEDENDLYLKGLQLGETANTAYRGDRGKIAYDHTSLTNNPHNVTKAQVGLGNVDNTSDIDKPISTDTQSAITAEAARATAAEANLQANITNEVNRATAAEVNLQTQVNAKANSADINSPVNITFSDLVSNTYTNALFANQSAVLLANDPNGLQRYPLTFNSSGVITLPFIADSSFSGTIIGISGTLGNYVTKTQFDVLDKHVNGQVVTNGVADPNSGYTIQLSNTLTIFNNKPYQIAGYINQITFNCVKVGNIVFRFIRPNGDGTYLLYKQFTYNATTLGINTLIAGTNYTETYVSTGDYLGAYFTGSTGVIGTKNLTATSFRLSGTMTVGASYGSALSTNYEMGLNCIVESSSVDLSIEKLDAAVFGADEIIRESDLTFTSNGFNIYNTGTISNNTIVNSSGNIATATGWKTLTIPIEAGKTKIYVNRITVNATSSWYTFSPIPALLADRVYGNSKILGEVGEFSVDIPAWATAFNIDIAAPLDTTDAGYKDAYIGYDTEAFLEKVKGADIIASNASGTADYDGLKRTIPHTWNAVGHSIWYQDGKPFATPNPDNPDAGQLGIGIQTHVKDHIQFSGYNNYGYSGRSLAGSSLADTQCILEQKETWVAGKIWTYDSITNDHKLNRPIGTTNDFLNNTGVTTYYGALRILHDTIASLTPDYIMICASPLQKVNGTYTSFSVNTAGHTMQDYIDALQWVRNRLSWRFVDQFKDSGFNMENILYNTWDGLHPINGSKENPIGYYRYFGLWLNEFYKLF